MLSAHTGASSIHPGSVGTLQEIFWTEEVPVYPMMDDMLRRGKYQNLLLTLTDDSEEIVSVLERLHNMRKTETNN